MDQGRADDAFDIEDIEEVIHGRVRLGIMAFLAGAELAEFAALKSRLGATDGNLSVHLRKLEDAGYVDILKSFQGRKPLTQARITPRGRAAFLRYLDAMSRLVSEAGGG